MNDSVKTLVFVGLALAAVAAAALVRPAATVSRPEDEINKPLFARFTNPLDARTLEIAYMADPEKGGMRLRDLVSDRPEYREFQVAQVDGVWVIPSHQRYPADAENKIRDAATALVDLNVIAVASRRAADHELYGVIDPDPEKVEPGQRGVGRRVAMKDARGRELAALVIGAKVKDTEDQYFVRVPGQDPVYVVRINPGVFSANFSDWIETDLLKLSSWDIREVTLNDYSVQTSPMADGRLAVVGFDERSKITVKWNDRDYKWELGELQENRGGRLRSTQLLEGEELNKERLDALKDALDDLKIVDVERKPEGLGADLKAEKGFMESREGVQSLIARGFYPVQRKPNEFELLSSNGEVLVQTQDGVEYTLRFGEIAGIEQGEQQGKLNRYLMVSVRVNEDAFPRPELAPLPELPSGGDPPPVGTPEQTPDAAPGDSADTDPAGETASESDSGTANDDEHGAAAEEAAGPAATDEPPPADAPPADGEPLEAVGDAAPAEGSETESPETPAEDGAESPAEMDEFDLAAERERITRENQRKLDEYNDKVKKARDKVRELNARFADWYYVIPEDEYKKIHLSRSDIIREADRPAEEGTDIDAFRELEAGIDTGRQG